MGCNLSEELPARHRQTAQPRPSKEGFRVGYARTALCAESKQPAEVQLGEALNRPLGGRVVHRYRHELDESKDIDCLTVSSCQILR